MKYPSGSMVEEDYPESIRRIRATLGLTRQNLAERLGVSCDTVNRWESGRSKPSHIAWSRLRRLEFTVDEEQAPYGPSKKANEPPIMDFTGDPEAVKILAEGERLSFGHLMNPAFATEISRIDPLPHQRIAVYDHMLKQSRLRFLLADDAGAGKTIMAGLYIREMLSRRMFRRILIVPPAGLIGNWHRELMTLFSMPFRIIGGNDSRNDNPFMGENSDRLIVSIDTLSSPKVFQRLRDPNVAPYELVIFDEAHKLAANRGADLRVTKTGRYCLAEALAGLHGLDDRWTLTWSAHHILLLTATPHMGKDYPYYALWRLLEPAALSTPEAFGQYGAEQRRKHFIRRTKEEMVHLDGKPLYPKRITDTLGYDLTQGKISEQKLYDETTEYLRVAYNSAKFMNREAVRLAASVLQRRLASSTYALMCSFERRIVKLDNFINAIQDGKLSEARLSLMQRGITDEVDILDTKTADDESSEAGREANEIAEEKLLQGIVTTSLAALLAEKDQVMQLLSLAKQIYEAGTESKFEKLREILTDPRFNGEKFIVFTEHRDTLEFLLKRLNGLGYTDQVARIHGGMHYTSREEEVERFKKPLSGGGARILICTDAAGEGINLQFCWIMINYDVPWNPARLEQRMGRIHRYGQKHDPVIIINLVAPSTREGKVLKTLLDKLEKIRRELQSDKVFDCIGRIFSGVSIKQYMEEAITEEVADTAVRKLEGWLTKEQLEAIIARDKVLYGCGGDVAGELPRLKASLEREVYYKLLPGYVRQYIGRAAPLVNIDIEGDMDEYFAFRPLRPGAIDPLLPVLALYPERAQARLTVVQPREPRDQAAGNFPGIWLHPGEALFEEFRKMVTNNLRDSGMRGAVFMDPTAQKPYLFHLALVKIIRSADSGIEEFARRETLECRLVGVKQYECPENEGPAIAPCPVEHLLLLKGGHGLPASAQRLAATTKNEKERAQAFLTEQVARDMVMNIKHKLIESIPEREILVGRGFDYKEAELAAARAAHSDKVRYGNKKATEALAEVKRQQRRLTEDRTKALAAIRREPELIGPGSITFVAHAIVVPSSDPIDIEQHEINVEMAAMQHVRAFEEAAGAMVTDVHTPQLASIAGLPEHPGFDLLAVRPDGEKRHIEVKGRAGTGDIEISANEWAKACNLRKTYWLYAVYDCATPTPRLARVQDPFEKLLAKAKGSVLISPKQINEASDVI